MPKEAKVGHKKKNTPPPDEAAAKLVMISGVGCRVSHNVTGKTDCGEYMTGFRYGTDTNVTCKACLKIAEKVIAEKVTVVS